VNQLYGATRALERLDTVIRSDGSLGIPLPPPEVRRVHRVSVSLGSRGLVEVKSADYGKGYVHVFDEVSFRILLRFLDTVTDFVEYLRAREDLYRLLPNRDLGGREEDLLAVYLHRGRKFPPELADGVIPHGLWDRFLTNQFLQAKLVEDEISYAWDRLIEYFAGHALEGTFELGNELNENEKVFRVLARESRLGRRILANAFLEFYELARSRKVSARILPSLQGITYVFLNNPPSLSRKLRNKTLYLRCFVARGLVRECATVIGIGVNVEPASMGHAEDVIYFHEPNWTPEHEVEAEKIKQELEFFATPQLTRDRIHEYPGTEFT
jgi:hypothetical protein